MFVAMEKANLVVLCAAVDEKIADWDVGSIAEARILEYNKEVLYGNLTSPSEWRNRKMTNSEC